MTVTESICPICGSDCRNTEQSNGIKYNCEDCGEFVFVDSTGFVRRYWQIGKGTLDFESDKQQAAISHWVFNANRSSKKVPLITTYLLDEFLENPKLPTLNDKRDNLIRYIGETVDGPGQLESFRIARLRAVIGAESAEVVVAVFENLKKNNVLHFDLPRDRVSVAVSFTFEGWLHYEEIRRGKSSGRAAFMAMPFGKEDLENKWYPNLKEAVAETGFKLHRLDEVPKEGLIDIRMQEQIKAARFLVVELTYANNGAYWEAGYAHGLGKPVFYTCKKGVKPHFDVDHWLRIEWEPDKMDIALINLKATIRNTLPDAYPDPVLSG